MVTDEQSLWLDRMLRRVTAGPGASAIPSVPGNADVGMINPDLDPAPEPEVLLEEVRGELGLTDDILVNEDGGLLWHYHWTKELRMGAQAEADGGQSGEEIKEFLRAEIKRLQGEKRRLPLDIDALLGEVRSELDLTDEILVQENGELLWHRSWEKELLDGARARAGDGEKKRLIA